MNIGVNMNDKISRKDFLRKCSTLTIAASLSYIGFNSRNAFSQTNVFDLVAVRGGKPDDMFDEAVKTMGGTLSGLIKKGQTVVVKPNIGWDKTPDQGANTNPLLVKRIVEHCFGAGAKKVYVFDNSCTYWKSAYKNSGIESAAKEAGATIAPGDSSSYYQKVAIPGKNLKTAQVHELILDSDVFINVPVLKNHMSARMTSAIKNLMGVVYDRGVYHSNGLHQCIADFGTYRKPDLNIIDAYIVMEKNGPRGISKNDLVKKKMQIVSRDMVLADAAAAKILGYKPENIGYITISEELKIGSADLEKASIKRIVL
jgi:uncharacterized protein (DUF362 family)